MSADKNITTCTSPGTWIVNSMERDLRCPFCGRKIKPGAEHRYKAPEASA